ncbi:Origin recognition complex subunit 2, partial [Spiromyces aspiralis]
RELLNRFATTMLTDAPVLIVNGYFPSSNIRYVLSRIMDAVGDKEYFSTVSTSSVTDLAATIAAYFDDWQGRRLERLYLVIHNIDGPALRKETVQSVLGILACSSGIHIIASVDHINAPLMWDASILSHFNWCWHDLTTFAPYYVETSYENSTMMLKTQNVDVRGVVHVLSSLTSNAKSIFKVLVEHQLKIEEEDEDSPKGGSNGVGEGEEEAAALATNGLLFHTYYTRCRDAFLVSSELTFRSQLTEFRDHKIIQSKRMPDGSELLFTPLKSHQLRAILEQVDLG